MILALAFVPTDDVYIALKLFTNEAAAEPLILDYFQRVYVAGRTSEGYSGE